MSGPVVHTEQAGQGLALSFELWKQWGTARTNFVNVQNRGQQSLLGDLQLECRQDLFYSLEPGSPLSILTRMHRVVWAAGSTSETWNLGDRFFFQQDLLN